MEAICGGEMDADSAAKYNPHREMASQWIPIAWHVAGEFTGALKDAEIGISIDGKGDWMFTVFIEGLWRSLKYECVYLNAFDTGSEGRNGIGQWMSFYNGSRTDSALNGRTPEKVYTGFCQEPLAA